MKCFKHFDREAITSKEVRIGKTPKGDTLEFKPVCQECVDEHEKYIKEEKTSDQFWYITIGAAAFVVVVFYAAYFSFLF